MKMQTSSLCVVVVMLCAWCSLVSPPVAAEEVLYQFDFNDGVVPQELNIQTFRVFDDPTDTITCDASSGQLRIYDTVSVSCGMMLYPEESLTDTHIRTVIIDPTGNCSLVARDNYRTDEDYDNYGCWLWRPPHTNGVALFLDKTAGGQTIYSKNTATISDPGPYIVELDVVDRETAEGVGYTAIEARLLYNDGRNSLTLHADDFGTLGGHGRIASGNALFGASLGSNQRDRGWLLDATFDDVVIRGTLVPEPAGLCLLLAGTALLVLRRRSPIAW